MKNATLRDSGTPVVRAKLRVPRPQGLPRERLLGKLCDLEDRRLAIVTAPAGSGKTTLLAQYADTLDVPVAWYQAESADGNLQRLLQHLEETLATALGGIRRPWATVDDAVRALEDWPGARAVLIIDDLHALENTPSEQAIHRLAMYAPPTVRMVMASRRQPRFNLSRLRVADRILELDANALRFRSWEVERLFRDFYVEPLPPEDLASLARRTEGWAAGLQLFHLATRGKPASERRRTLQALSSRSKLVREYLTQNVIAELPTELREFLLETCVLGRLTGPLCDQLLGRSGTAAVLVEIERRQIFLCPLEEEGAWRYHEVLRSYLEAGLVDQVGEAGARERFARAGKLLEAAEAWSDAIRAYCRADDQATALQLLHDSGAGVAAHPGAWMELLPADLANHDPWLMLAAARRHVAGGHWAAALNGYRLLEGRLVGAAAAEQCRRERLALTMWLEPVSPLSADWAGLVCQATRRDPLDALMAAQRIAGPHGRLAAGLAALLAGQLHGARRRLLALVDDMEASALVAAGAQLGAAVAGLLLGSAAAAEEVDIAREQAEDLGFGWLAQLASGAAQCLSLRDPAGAQPVRDACDAADDAWGKGIVGLFQGLGGMDRPEPAIEALEVAAGLFHRLGAGVLEAWALAGVAVAKTRAGHPDARNSCATAESLARAAAAWGPMVAVQRAWAVADPAQAAQHLSLAGSIDADCARPLAIAAEEPAAIGLSGPAAAPARRVVVTCFGDFTVTVDGHALDLTEVKPRVRSLIRLLALHAGRPVHRDALADALWPGATAAAGTRNLHVAVSAARQLLDQCAPGLASVLTREGDTYRLALAGDSVDIVGFEQGLAAAARARAGGDRHLEVTALERALDLYRGELLTAERLAEWAHEPRERCRVLAADAAECLADAYLAAGDHPAAARVCERGLAIDRYRDRLWQLRMSAHEAAGEVAAAARAQDRYREMLTELGVRPAAF